MGQLVGGYPDPGVGHRQHRARPGGAYLDRDPAALRGELQRVRQQIHDQLVQPAGIGQDVSLGEAPLQGDPGRFESADQAGDGVVGQVGQVAAVLRQVQRRGVGGCKGLQVVDHVRQPQHLVAQRGQLFRGGLGNPVQHGLMPGLQHRDRGAELMGHVGDQIPAQLLLAGQRVGHLIEGGRQLAQLGWRGDPADPGGALPAPHGPRHGDDPLDRAGDPPGHRQPGQQRQQGRYTGRAGDGPQQRDLQAPVGAAEAGTGEPDHDPADRPAPHHGRRAELRCRRLRGEPGRV